MWSYLITFIAIAVFPLALAGYGGHLATLGLPNGSKEKRRALIIVWTLAAIGVLLFGVVQMTAYHADSTRDKKDEAFRNSVETKLQAIIDEPDIAARKEQAVDFKAQIVSKVMRRERKLTPLPAKTQVSQSPTENPSSDQSIKINIGPSLDPKYAFETRFILTNNTTGRLTKARYECVILNENTDSLKLDHPTAITTVRVAPIENLPKGFERSLYCDFASDPIANQLNAPIVQIWVSYTVNSHEESMGFRFFAKRKPEDQTFVWLPGGESAPVETLQR